ncbi:FAD-binding oxidoreductase [Nocardia sp. NPDC127526]|uniref:FAD-binding oxidoreductase n=1 Tax=Nocardia sp. NPDC127526 TaxID=3345393 RepID=UPI00364167CD
MGQLSDLRAAVRGSVLLAEDAGFDQARLPWNRAVKQSALAVVEAADAEDVAALVRYAAERGLTVAAQPSGHGASGDTDGVILLRTNRLTELSVDSLARTARVGAGVTWGAVLAEAGPYGLTGLAGSSPVVSVAGYTLGGGLSWFSRRYGWAADSVTAFDVVTADGTRARATAEINPDLFWALRGGGGDFAIVTAIEFDLHPAPDLFGGNLLWPAEHTAAAVHAFREITATAPDELSVWLDLVHFPGSAPMVSVEATYLGRAEEARELLRPFTAVGAPLAESLRTLPVAELGAVSNDPTDPGPGSSRAELLTDLDDVAVKALLAEPISPLLLVQLRHLGGALTRPSSTPQGPIAQPYLLYLFGLPLTTEITSDIADQQQKLVDALGDRATGHKPFGFLNPNERAANAFPEPALARLREIKQQHDPQSVLRSNFPVLG